MTQLSQMIDDARARARILERAIQKVLDTPAAGMSAEQFKNRITGGLNDALHADVKPQPEPEPTERKYWEPYVITLNGAKATISPNWSIKIASDNPAQAEEYMHHFRRMMDGVWRSENEGYIR